METTRFGPLTIDTEQIITVAGGLLGLPGYTRFVILQPDQEQDIPFRWLQSVEHPALAFVIINPWDFKPDYAIELPDGVCEKLHLSTEEAPMVFAIVTVPLEPTQMTANLQGPLVMNLALRQAQQVVLSNSPYTTQHLILTELCQSGDADHVVSSCAHHSGV